MKRENGVVVDMRMFHHLEQSESVITLCIEQRQFDTRQYHRDFYLTLSEALVLKKSIDDLKLEELEQVL